MSEIAKEDQWAKAFFDFVKPYTEAVGAYLVVILIFVAVVIIFTAKPVVQALVQNADNKRKHSLALRTYNDKIQAQRERNAQRQAPKRPPRKGRTP